MSLIKSHVEVYRRWWRRRFPELEMFATFEDAAGALFRATEQGGMQKRDYVLVGLILLVILAIILVAVIIQQSVGPVWSPVMRVVEWTLPFVLAFGIVSFLVHFHRRAIQRSLREQLCAVGVPVCMACGYDLRGQVDPRCPECGRPFDPTLLRKE
jgi:hypothetical protein